MKTTAFALLSALVLFHVTASEMVIAQEAAGATTGGHPLLRALKDGVPELSFSYAMSMSMPPNEEGIVPPGPSSSSIGGVMADFLSNFKEEHIEVAESLSGKQSGSRSKFASDGVTSSASVSKLDGGFCDDPTKVYACFEDLINFFDAVINTTCIDYDDYWSIDYGKSSKSGKSGSFNSKIKRTYVDTFSYQGPATIYNEVMLAPRIDNGFPVRFNATDLGEAQAIIYYIFHSTLLHLLILEYYLTCADSKFENILKLDIYVNDFFQSLFSEYWDAADIFRIALVVFWYERVGGDVPFWFVGLGSFSVHPISNEAGYFGLRSAIQATAAVN